MLLIETIGATIEGYAAREMKYWVRKEIRKYGQRADGHRRLCEAGYYGNQDEVGTETGNTGNTPLSRPTAKTHTPRPSF
jgi:hypothetical protein